MIWKETVETHGVKIHTPIGLACLIGEARKDGLSYKVWPWERGQQFGVLVDPKYGDHDGSLYFSDGEPVFLGITDGKRIIRGVVAFDGCTFEAELRNGQLHIATTMTAKKRQRFLRRIENGKI